MLTIADLTSSTGVVSSAQATFRGRAITVRALSAYETQQLAAIYPRPTPPPAVRPGGHPIHGEIFYNESDAGFWQQLAAWTRRLMALEVAASIELAVPIGNPPAPSTLAQAIASGKAREWAAGAAEALSGPASSVTQGELDGLWNLQRDLSDVPGDHLSKLELAKKALSGLSRAQALALVSQIFPSTESTD